VDYPSFVKELRSGNNDEEVIAHKSIFTLVCEIMSRYPEAKGVPVDLGGETDKNSKIAYFPGCINFFNCFLDIDMDFREIGLSSVRLLNKIEIKPRVLPLRCCGHDALWQGRKDLFDELRRYNTDIIERSDAEILVTSCAECFRTFSKDYELDLEVVHISQMLEKNMDKLNLEAKGYEVTYHDPCRLGRHMGIYDAPRNVLQNVKGLVLKELNETKENSQCCGVSAWVSCDTKAKILMAEKLDSAMSTGAQFLITTCPKCLAHLNCLKNENPPIKDFDIDVVDLAVFLSRVNSDTKEGNRPY
jgi:Fe-S oxidoreductase